MRHFAVALALAFLPVILSAQPVMVQAGEHASFTRVVVRLPAGAAWELGRDADGYVLRLPVTNGYDLRRFFDLIPRRRITAVSQDVPSGALRLAVECACRADAFVIETGFLVIDIADGAAEPGAPFEQLIDGANGPARAAMETAGPGTWPVVFPRTVVLRAAPTIPLLSNTEMRQPEAPALAQELDALERLVVESLGRGLTAGLLEPDMATGTTALARLPQITRDVPLPGVSVSSGLDRAALPQQDQAAMTSDGMVCTPDAFFSLAAWADDRTFGDQIASKRSVLVHEFDRFDPEVITELARLYLHFGFGREAIQTLELDATQSMERSYLRLLAQIIDDDVVRFPDLDRQITCPSNVALWAFLALPRDRVTDAGDRAAILRAFKDVPPHLQRHLGPRLSERFAAVGDDDAAYQALAVAQMDAPAAVETRTAAATLAVRLGNDAAAFETLTGLAQTNARITPDAMVQFLNEAVRQNRIVPAADMIIADALRFEHALTPAAGDLAAAQAQAYLVADAFVDAARLIDDAESALGGDRHRQLLVDYGHAAGARMSDADFLAFSFLRPLPADEPDLHALVARRLILLGFPDHALSILAVAPSALPEDDRRYLQAAALLDLQDPDAAMRILRDDPSDQANDLRQVARALRAGNTTAAATWSNPDEAANSWRNGDWANLAQTDDPLLQGAVAAMMDTDGSDFDSQMPLASGRALLDQAGQSRLLLDGLLERFAPPGDF